ncbi:hypothetical protein [Shimia aestuarii]|uniref:Glycerophosphoryl diester phosphodiesterase membrane domain-containing protein n=1 Tax=Shimia aestuarii TaxID=254406 RepID=A0A1I4KJ48_9RHOB|nr:hypothetical protein [Shimia aestuarii]SFL78830.1 hypothetical protein SAMN04488042_1011509 [Shimia aestuarii]
MNIELFKHSLRLVVGNWQTSLRLSTPLVVIMVLGLVLVGPEFFVQEPDPSGRTEVSPTSGLLQLLLAVSALWVAVAWHRFILLEEYPTGAVPAFHGGRMLAYFWRALLMGLTVGLGAVLIITGVWLVLFWAAPVAVLITIFVGIGTSWAFYRLSPILPGAAIEKPLKMGQAWQATKPLSGAILATMFLFVVSIVVLVFAGALVAGVIPLLGGLVLLGINWLYIMLGISILTTIYGIAVEKRTV